MIRLRFCVMVLVLLSIATMVQAQQSEFQGTWNGQAPPVDRTGYRIVISGNNWRQYFRGELEGAGTARFSAGRAELLLADGRLA